MLDTGSSAFALLTDKSNWERLSQGGKGARTFGVNSWGKTLTAHVAETDASLTLGGHEMPLNHVAYIDGTSRMQNLLMRFSGMGGMTGNKLLTNKVLILSTKDMKYWILDYLPNPISN